MISKLPRWVEYGTFLLALNAGFINAVGLLGFKHQSVSHLSGTATLLGTGAMSAGFNDLLYLFGVLFSFVMGAAVSGYFLRGEALKLGRNYSALLCLEATFLCGASYLLIGDFSYGIYLASAACGLQNALATTYSGAVVRTTHVTGIFTDLGIMLGAVLRGDPFDKRRALLFSLIVLGFILGGTLGALGFANLAFYSLLIPAGVCLFLALFYSVYKAKHKAV
ncbi:membrane protein [Agarivorans sp. OAG1]|uniref:YoaK family protein n=1 Tax=Agarivorans sp. OAG1 TaxID=3082387 RepID=UPI002B2DF050|nr:membrane protein [Agarivorans sp. OAG1]